MKVIASVKQQNTEWQPISVNLTILLEQKHEFEKLKHICHKAESTGIRFKDTESSINILAGNIFREIASAFKGRFK